MNDDRLSSAKLKLVFIGFLRYSTCIHCAYCTVYSDYVRRFVGFTNDHDDLMVR